MIVISHLFSIAIATHVLTEDMNVAIIFSSNKEKYMYLPEDLVVTTVD